MAVAIGTAHGNYLHHKVPRLDFDRLLELKSLLNMPLVLHGGSGSGDENLRKAVSCGINKVNICTDAFQICKTAFLLTQAQQPDMDYMHLCMAVEQQMKAFTRHHLDVLGAFGTVCLMAKTSRIRTNETQPLSSLTFRQMTAYNLIDSCTAEHRLIR